MASLKTKVELYLGREFTDDEGNALNKANTNLGVFQYNICTFM